MRWLKKILVVCLILVLVYWAGPSPEKPVYSRQWPVLPSLDSLEGYIAGSEAKHRIKPGNEAGIVWANDSLRNQTDVAIVYLHGFSASHEEGNPVHRNIAKRFGCNLYLSRLSDHGIDTSDQLLNLTADRYWESAKEALARGERLGKKVILMGTSTGATQALQLAATFPDKVSALILYSPNIAVNDPNAWMLNNHWGLQIARMVIGGKELNPKDERPVYKRFWNKPYRLEAAVQLEEMLETTMRPELFRQVTQPVLMLYYYRNPENQDKVVRVDAMQNMFAALGTDAGRKREMAMPLTGDHVIASPIKSKDVAGVERETVLFMEQVLKMKADEP